MLNKIYDAREYYDITQRALAIKVGVTSSNMSYIERGIYMPSIVVAMKIASILNARVEDVFILENSDWNKFQNRRA